MTREHPCLKDRSFDVVIDTLVWSGLKSPEMPGYFRQVARVLRPGGLFVLHARIPGCPEFDVKPRTDLPSSLRQWFRMTDGYITHLADFRNKKRDHADIAVYLGRRRARRVPPTALRFARWETPRRA
jgi:SAM-dependent methyltransferase